MSQDPKHVREAILRNARAANRDRLRNEALRRWGTGQSADELEDRVRELEREQGAMNGKKGAATLRHLVASGRTFDELRPMLAGLLRLFAEIQANCAHCWPPELDDEAACDNCGLLYVDYVLRHRGLATREATA